MVAHSFSKAALTYDIYADVQSEVATCLMTGINDRSYGKILEIGCGTGSYTLMLASRFANSYILAVDISPIMIAQAKMNLDRYTQVHFKEADGEYLPAFVSGTFDLITSSGVFQWFENLEEAIQRYSHILSSSGFLIFAIFGPDTLCELNKTLRYIFGKEICLPVDCFPGETSLHDYLSRVFNTWAIKKLIIYRTYPDLITLLRSFKYTGVSPRLKKVPYIRSPSRLIEIEKSYKKHFGTIRATYQVFICTGSKLYNSQ
jgi:malonyl-CoA O-methyltransferase